MTNSDKLNVPSLMIDQLTFTRFIAAFFVFVFHFGRDSFPFDLPVIGVLGYYGNLGVGFFFVLSGFVLVIAYQNRSQVPFGSFIRNRLIRILPAFVVAALMMLGYLLFSNNTANYLDVFLSLSFLQAWFPGRALVFNAPAWSLSVELFFYLIFPLLLRLVRKISFTYFGIAVLVLYLITQILSILIFTLFYDGFPSATHDFLYYFPFFHVNEFLIGMLFAWIYLDRFKQHISDVVIIALSLGIEIIIYWLDGVFLHNGMMAPLFGLGILFLSRNKGWFSKLFKLPILIFLGEISYAFYILQEPTATYLHKSLDMIGVKSVSGEFWLTFIALLILAALVTIFIEKPIKRYFRLNT